MGSGQLSVNVKRQENPPYRQMTAVERGTQIGSCVGWATRGTRPASPRGTPTTRPWPPLSRRLQV